MRRQDREKLGRVAVGCGVSGNEFKKLPAANEVEITVGVGDCYSPWLVLPHHVERFEVESNGPVEFLVVDGPDGRVIEKVRWKGKGDKVPALKVKNLGDKPVEVRLALDY